MKVTLRQPKMNKTEAEYASRLEVLLRAGEVTLYQFERYKIRLGKSCYYTPDFFVIRNGVPSFHEVKGGFVRDDAIVKYKCAAEAANWCDWFWCQKVGSTWKITKHE